MSLQMKPLQSYANISSLTSYQVLREEEEFFGCIVNTSKLHVTEIKGTGEAAAQVLSQNGLSIKISRDSTIKLYLPDEERPVLI
ncbi:MAG: hypothetical protein LPK07_13245 [Hymenobacteraceae bacterium]|nr:hypothetical protein [Hymenobacteraceae bacterium]